MVPGLQQPPFVLTPVLICGKAKWVAIFGYSVVMVITTAVMEITQAAGVYCQTSFSPQFAQIWVRTRLCQASLICAGLTSQPDLSHPELCRRCRRHKHNLVLQSPGPRNGSTQAIGENNKLQADRRREFPSKRMFGLPPAPIYSHFPVAGANRSPPLRSLSAFSQATIF